MPTTGGEYPPLSGCIKFERVGCAGGRRRRSAVGRGLCGAPDGAPGIDAGAAVGVPLAADIRGGARDDGQPYVP